MQGAGLVTAEPGSEKERGSQPLDRLLRAGLRHIRTAMHEANIGLMHEASTRKAVPDDVADFRTWWTQGLQSVSKRSVSHITTRDFRSGNPPSPTRCSC